MAQTNLTVFGNGAGNAECLQTDTDSGSGISSLLAALLHGDRSADGVRPNGVFEADGLGFANDLVAVDAHVHGDLFAFLNGGDAVFFQNLVDFVNASFVTFKQCHRFFLL